MKEDQNLKKAKDLIERFNKLWNIEAKDHICDHSLELRDISHKLESMKLADEFLLRDLDEEEKEILDKKVFVISRLR